MNLRRSRDWPHSAATHSPLGYTRRQLLAVLLLPCAAFAGSSSATRKLSFEIIADGFNAPASNIEAVVTSAAESLWRHCPATTFEFGFRVYRNEKHPITHYVPEDGRIVIGLATESTFWAQYAYQFAHEFCHALLDHANDWRRLWRDGKHANQWLEESLCETASLFALRAMGKQWETDAPYANWRSFAPRLSAYAEERIQDPRHRLPESVSFLEWLNQKEPEQREKWTRENNTVIAVQLLPLFEREPSGWGALPFLNLCTREADKPLERFLQEWLQNAPAQHRAFITQIKRTLTGEA
jgi:hypothetical protein